MESNSENMSKIKNRYVITYDTFYIKIWQFVDQKYSKIDKRGECARSLGTKGYWAVNSVSADHIDQNDSSETYINGYQSRKMKTQFLVSRYGKPSIISES